VERRRRRRIALFKPEALGLRIEVVASHKGYLFQGGSPAWRYRQQFVWRYGTRGQCTRALVQYNKTENLVDAQAPVVSAVAPEFFISASTVCDKKNFFFLCATYACLCAMLVVLCSIFLCFHAMYTVLLVFHL
jgi:hypothetical protein